MGWDVLPEVLEEAVDQVVETVDEHSETCLGALLDLRVSVQDKRVDSD